MKTFFTRLPYFATMMLLLLSCSKSKRVDGLLKDQEMRDEVLFKITNDSVMTREMLNSISGNERVLQEIRSDKRMMKSLLTQEQMMDLMQNDSMITNMLMCNVMKIAGKDTNLCRRIDIQMKKNLLFEDPNLQLFPNFQSVAKDKIFIHRKIKIPEAIKK